MWWRRQREAELDEELQAHIELETARLESEEGLSRQDAEQEARRTFGSRALVAELTRETWGARWLTGIRQDLEYVLRSARRSPVFSAAVILSLALGMGAATTVFSVADTVYFRPLPYRAPDQLMFVAMHLFRMDMVLSPDYVLWRRDSRAFQQLAAMQYHGGNLATLGDSNPVEVRFTRVSHNFVTTLGLTPALGRNFQAADEVPGSPRTAILTDALWRRQFHARPDIVGRSITLDGVPHQVIGVLPSSFIMPLGVPTEILTPLPIAPTISHHDKGLAVWTVIGRLSPGVTQAQALADVQRLFTLSKADAPNIFRNDCWVWIEPLRQRMAGDAQTLLLVLAGAVGCLLMIACGNVANLLIARWSARSRELAVRAAIGASRSRLIRQLLTETAAWCGAGSAIALILASLGMEAVVHFAGSSLPRLNEVRMDARVFAIALGVSVVTMCLFGILPALRAGRVDVQSVIQQGGRAGVSTADRGARRILVAGEVALSVVLLWGAVLLLQTLWRMQHDRLGFQPEHVVSVSVPLRDAQQRNTGRKALTQEMLARIRAVPGTLSASWGECTPLSGGPMNSIFTRSDRPLPKPWDRGDGVAGCAVGPDYFQASGLRVLRGRAFTETDYDHPQTVAIINEALARQYFPGENPVGHQIDGHAKGGWKTVIGVVSDSKNRGLNQSPMPQMFLNDLALQDASEMSFVVRYVGSESLFASTVQAQLRELAPGLLARFETLEEAIARMSSSSRFNGLLMATFAGIAFLMAVIGVYGVLAFAVTQRTQEIGIRMALGASPLEVQGLVLREGMILVGVGAVLGVILSLLAGRYLKTLLYGITVTDLRTYLAVLVAVGSAALLASWIPARRAASLDPALTLRSS